VAAFSALINVVPSAALTRWTFSRTNRIMCAPSSRETEPATARDCGTEGWHSPSLTIETRGDTGER
jgi:hypothetical protein